MERVKQIYVDVRCAISQRDTNGPQHATMFTQTEPRAQIHNPTSKQTLPFSSPTMSSPDSKPKGHQRHDTALIHGLSASEVQKLSEACVEAKGRAYCKQCQPLLYTDEIYFKHAEESKYAKKRLIGDGRPVLALPSRMLSPSDDRRYYQRCERGECGVPRGDVCRESCAGYCCRGSASYVTASL